MVFGFGGGKHKKEKQRSASTNRPVQARANSDRGSGQFKQDASSGSHTRRSKPAASRRHSTSSSAVHSEKTWNATNTTNTHSSNAASKTHPRSALKTHNVSSVPNSNLNSSPTTGARSVSPLKSAMKTSSKYQNPSQATATPPTALRQSLSTPISPRGKHKYTGPIDVDDISLSASLSTSPPPPPPNYTAGTSARHKSSSITNAVPPPPIEVDVDDLPSYRPAPLTATPVSPTTPTSTIKSAVKRTEAVQKPPAPPLHVVTPPPKSPATTSPKRASSSVPTSILHQSPSNASVTKSVLTYDPSTTGPSSLAYQHNTGSVASGFSKDDMSIISLDKSLDTMSVMSRVSVHMDHFLAEMALADNAQLEQLAVEEMKHRQIIPQKIKKLNKKIGVLHEEREVLVGLIDQLQELVDNQEENKRKRREKRKEKKRMKKEKKKQKKKEEQEKALAEANKQEETDSDDEYLAQAHKIATTNKTNKNWWADDDTVGSREAAAVTSTTTDTPKDKASDNLEGSTREALDASDPILGASSGSIGDDDDEFAKLWNDSSYSGESEEGEALDTPTMDLASSTKPEEASSNTAAKIAAGVGAAAVGVGASIAAVTSARNKKKKEESVDVDDLSNDEDKIDDDKTPKTKPKSKVEAFALVETLPDKPEDDDFAEQDNKTQEDDLESDDDRNLLLPATLGVAGGAAAGAAVANSSSSVSSSKKSPPTSLRSLRLARAGKTGMSNDDDDSLGSGKMNKRAGRFSVFQETDTYLPDHMPGSQGNTPDASERGAADGSDSDSDSDSDSESQESKSSGSSVSTNPIMLEEEEEEQPSSSHFLAQQLMARLKQQEKQQEQEELQRSLQGIIRRNSQRRLSESGASMDGSERSAIDNLEAMANQPTSGMVLGGGAITPPGVGDHPINSDLGYNIAPASSTPAAVAVSPAMDNKEATNLRKKLDSSMEELEKLRQERKVQELRVKQLLEALDTKFDEGDDADDEEEELEEADDINDSIDEYDAPQPKKEEDSPKKRKRMQVYLTQKVDECAELTATVEQLTEQVSQKQAKIDELQAQTPSDVSRSIPAADTTTGPNPPGALVSSVSSDLSKDSLQKQLLEKTAESFDLQEQIKKLEEQLQEKDQQYQEVHRDLFTANLALGVEVDRKATAQEALDEKCQEFESVQKENEDLVAKMAKCDERMEALDDELLSRATMLDEMKSKHDQGLHLVASELETTKSELTEKTNDLEGLRQRVADLEREKDEIIDKGSANDRMVVEMRNLLVVEADKKDQLELRVSAMERDKQELEGEMERIKKESEINKALLQDKTEFETADGKGSANIQAEVEKLIAENAELKKTLTGVQESEASMKKERERLVANATNMSIMLADSRAKVDFIQMQLEEHKNGALSNSAHGMKSQSDHGFGEQKLGFRKLLASAPTGGGATMGESSERSVGSLGGSQRGARSARFRSFLQNRMGGAGAADSATTG